MNQKALKVEELTQEEKLLLKRLRKDGAGLINLKYMFKLNSVQEVLKQLNK